MSSKSFRIIVVCILVSSIAQAQKEHFKLPAGTSPNSYEAGVVWVKAKAQFKSILQNPQSAARMPAQFHGAKIKPFAHPGSTNKSFSRIAPRKMHVDISQYFKINFDKNFPLEEYINELYETGYFEVVEPVAIEQSLFTPNDPLSTNQYYLNLIKANEAWDITTGNPSIVIGIVDSGGDLDHPDLQSNIYVDPADPTDGIDNDNDGYIDNNRGWDFSGADAALVGTPGYVGDNNPQVYVGGRHVHGTMVAGCASATTNDGVGISGVGFNTKLLFTKHYADNQPSNSNYYSSSLYEGLWYAATHGAKIINCSWGNSTYNSIAQDIIKHVTLDLGCLVVAAAGNSNAESPLYPAAYDYVLSVASSDQNDVRSTFSNYGKTVDITAPGSSIYTTCYNDMYWTDSGTSLAAPIVSGAAALVWAHNPSFSPLQVAEQLRISADESFYGNNPTFLGKLGKGRLDVARALTLQSPSIRTNNQRLVNNDGDFPGPGEQAKLYFDFQNFLKPNTSALTVTLTSGSPYLTITQDQFHPGVIPTGQITNNESAPFEFTFAPNLPIDQPFDVVLTFTDGSYQDTQIVTFVIPTSIDINENNITTTITSAGRLGFGNTLSQTNGSGFIYDSHSLLYEMGVIMGTSSSVIFDNVRNIGGVYNQDFTSATKIKKITPGEKAFSEVSGSFRNAVAAGSETLLVSYKSMVWENDPYKNFVILEYKIKNTTGSDVSNFYMGIFSDWDVLSAGASDRAAWDNNTRLGYVYAAQPSSLPRVGIQALTGTPNYYAIDNDESIAGNPFGIYDGFTDAEKFSSISSGLSKVQAGGTSGTDVSHVVSSGPYAINAGEEITIAFALHGANTLNELISSAKYADSLYNYTMPAPKPIAGNIESCEGANAILEATGATKFNWYKELFGGNPVSSGPQFVIPALSKDTIVYVSNADHSYESLRTPVSITTVEAPEIVAAGDLKFCEGGSVILASAAGDEYTWSTGQKTQQIVAGNTGSYTVSVRNGALTCTSLPVNVVAQTNPQVIPSGDLEFCEGESIILSTANGDEYTWNTGQKTREIEVNSVGIYSVTVRNASLECSSSTVSTVVNPSPSASFTTTTDVIYPEHDVLFTNQSTGAASWFWDFGDGETSTSESPVHRYTAVGNYTVTLTAISDKGCEASDERSLGIITEAETSLSKTTKLYPNPVNDNALVISRTGTSGVLEVEVFTTKGNLVYQQIIRAEEQETILNVSTLANGIYQIRIKADNEIFTRKIVVAR